QRAQLLPGYGRPPPALWRASARLLAPPNERTGAGRERGGASRCGCDGRPLRLPLRKRARGARHAETKTPIGRGASTAPPEPKRQSRGVEGHLGNGSVGGGEVLGWSAVWRRHSLCSSRLQLPEVPCISVLHVPRHREGHVCRAVAACRETGEGRRSAIMQYGR